MKNPRTCPCGKRDHRNQMDAITAALICSFRYGRPMRIYRCEHRGWHLTKLTTWTAA